MPQKKEKETTIAKIYCKYDELIDPNKLKNHPKNRNKHGQDQIDRLAELYKYHGIRHPIIISNLSKCIVAGHGRKLAAIRAGIKEMPVVYQDFENADKEYAFIQADNAIALWAELDLSSINTDITDLGPDFDINMLGLKDFLVEPADKESLIDEDEVTKEVEPKTKLGDIYQLGDHRLMCGDSTSSDQVKILMNGEKADITFTSPPYNLGDNAKLRGKNASGKSSAYRTNSDHKTQDEYYEFLIDITNNCLDNSEIMFNNIQILAGNKLVIPKYWNFFKEKLVDVLIWDKEHAPPQMAEHVLNSVWEFIFAFTNSENTTRSIDTGPKFKGTIDNIFRLNPVGKKDELAKNHRAVFPVAFAEHFVKNFSNKSVLDVFGGSGTTLIACEKNNRKCFMMELDPHYCDVIVARWEKYTGKKAELING